MVKTQPLVTTYLEMRTAPETSRDHKSQVSSQKLKVEELKERDWKFNRDMYFKVGESWKWIDKRPWADEQWRAYASDSNLRTFAGYSGGEVAGYFELRRCAVSENKDHTTHVTSQKEADPTRHSSLVTRHSDDEIEIAYFGLLPEFIGRGLGGALLTSAIDNAWAWSPAPSRVWVHTCNRDHPSALANYQARGFKIYKVTSDV